MPKLAHGSLLFSLARREHHRFLSLFPPDRDRNVDRLCPQGSRGAVSLVVHLRGHLQEAHGRPRAAPQALQAVQKPQEMPQDSQSVETPREC